MISYKKFDGYDSFKYRANFERLSNMSLLKETILTCAWSPIVWKNNYAKTDNFESSSFLALDFDTPGEETMEEINHSLQDHKRIIATTKSHNILKNGIVCDRFRLIIPFTKTITDYKTYKYTYQRALDKYPWADKSCTDGARFFFPSKEVVFFDRESEYKWEVLEPAFDPEADKFVRLPPTGKIPLWCLKFINDGVVGHSRNMTLLGVCCELFRQGFVEADVRRIVMRAKIDWHGVNLEAIIKSASKKELQ